MKRLTSIIVALLFIMGVASIGITAETAGKAEDKCVKCHKKEKAMDKVIEKKKIKTTAELLKAVKEGPKAKLHAKLTDDDIKVAAKELKLAE
ncbi:MAG: hypothetical protein A2X59_01490 [Nitrospirae bacterium GWC2_42_7]|nr:MAG: hypothetical protein A2X59_01490 [Nitrospirae bacterium GWC2_42_7]